MVRGGRGQHQGQRSSEHLAAYSCFTLAARPIFRPAPTPARVLAPPPLTAVGGNVAHDEGFVPYGAFCCRCHGVAAAASGILPDLRYSARCCRASEAWAAVVLDGALAPPAWHSFAPVRERRRMIDAIRAYVIAQAHAASAAQAAVAVPAQ